VSYCAQSQDPRLAQRLPSGEAQVSVSLGFINDRDPVNSITPSCEISRAALQTVELAPESPA